MNISPGMTRQSGIIVAMNPDLVIGLDGSIPWHYSADLKRFKKTTLNSTVIMGRHTWESLPIRPLPKRQNIVVASSLDSDVEHYPSIQEAMSNATNSTLWFIGGARIYKEAVNYCDRMDITIVPDRIEASNSVVFPQIDWSAWHASSTTIFEDDPRLRHQVYTKL